MNRRSKIHVRWTTDPIVLGYSTSATFAQAVRDVQAARDSFRRGAPDYTGSPRTALEYIAGIRRKIGDGTAYALHLTVAATGETVQPSDLRELLT